MTGPDLQRVEDIFYGALGVDDARERNAFVVRACAGDPGLRAAVEEMLSTQSEAETFFEETKPALTPAIELLQTFTRTAGLAATRGAEDAPDEPAGTRIGPYTVIEKIGEGGCGAVYLAQQDHPVRRQVALKIIKLGMDTRSVIARFKAEQQALALMDHPNIARVFDAGATATGRPYFVMELVRGVKLTDYCDENRLELRARLKLFIEVCHAIQHAHQKGVIHRDLKPSNILVVLHDPGAPGVPKVIDFGIAKATQGRLTETTLSTGFDQFIGTPVYMSPEQAQRGGLDVDTRSDIYSLGVLLYELLSGRTPFDRKQLLQGGLEEMRRTLRETEPRPPSKLVPDLPAAASLITAKRRRTDLKKLTAALHGDLDWIVMKALEKDRQRRYDTVNALADDVQRHLDNEPVSARPPSRIYRLRKLVRRNKVVFAAAAAVALALAAGMTASFWLLVRERDLRRRAVAAEHAQARLRETAERGLANEAELRREAEGREKITQAAALLQRGADADADALVAQLPRQLSTLEGASVFRALGEWNARQQRWLPARDRFLLLERASRVDDPGYTSLDSTRAAVTIVESGDPSQYERFCFETINRFSATADPMVAERAVKNCLLLPASDRLLKSLDPLARLAAGSLPAPDAKLEVVPWQVSWCCLSVSLWDYRVGNFSDGIVRARQCLGYGAAPLPRSASARVVLAMALFRLGETDSARAELVPARNSIDAKFKLPLDPGNSADGFWFDWVLARILLREASAVIGTFPTASK